jgi:hypothetical protein
MTMTATMPMIMMMATMPMMMTMATMPMMMTTATMPMMITTTPQIDNNLEAPHDEGAPNDDEEGAPPPPIRYNLRPHPIATRRFNHAIDEPHSGQGTTRLHNYYNDGVLQGTKIQHRHIKDNAALRKMVFGLVMTQMSAKAGIRKHGAAAEAAMMAEFTQLEDLGAYESIDPDTLDLGPKER